MNEAKLISILKAQQWEKVKGELRALVALAGSHTNDGSLYSEGSDTYKKWEKVKGEVDWFINHFEKHGLHE